MGSAADDRNRIFGLDGASLTLRGNVERILSAAGKNGSDVVQIVIEDAEPLYREIRIQNPFQDSNGKAITLQADSEVEITIKARR